MIAETLRLMTLRILAVACLVCLAGLAAAAQIFSGGVQIFNVHVVLEAGTPLSADCATQVQGTWDDHDIPVELFGAPASAQTEGGWCKSSSQGYDATDELP
jgi:hypothetical protein